MRKLKPIFIAMFIIMLVVQFGSVASAKPWSSYRNNGFDGHGGFFTGYQSVDFGDLEDLAKNMGIETPENGLWGWGGYGMGHVGNGWRIGGMGFGYSAKYSGIYTSTAGAAPMQFNRVMELSYGGGGFLVEYSPWMLGPVNFGMGATLGGGGIELRLTQDDGTGDWQSITDQFTNDPNDPNYTSYNVNSSFTQGFLLIQPYVTARIHILDWLALSGQAGYNFNTINTSKWEFYDRELTGDGTDLDTKQLFYRIGLAFGG